MRCLHRPQVAVIASLVALVAHPLHAQRPVDLSPNAPADKVLGFTARCQLAALKRAIAPLTAAARASFPGARQRFEAGLPAGYSFFVTTILRDSTGREEQVFVAVDSVTGAPAATRIAGRIWSPVQLVQEYNYRQPYAFDAAELVDWMIARPDGTEEGNEVGKFAERYQPPAACADSGATD